MSPQRTGERVRSQERQRRERQLRERPYGKKELIHVPADQAKFEEIMPGVSKADLWQDPKKESYGAFTRFAPGFDAGTHTHTNDVWLVVIQGAYLYRDDAGEKRVGPGGFLRIPSGMKHWSGGDENEGALFYEESSGKFDLVPVH